MNTEIIEINGEMLEINYDILDENGNPIIVTLGVNPNIIVIEDKL